MKRSLFLKYINAAILFGLVAPTAQLFSATNQNGLRKRTVGYVRSTGVGFGKGISSGAQRAYRGTATGLKRVGAGLALGKEKAITRAKKEQEHVMEGAQAALKRMKGKKLTKKEQDHLYSFEKRTGALLALLAILVGTAWIYRQQTGDDDAPEGPPRPAPVPAPPSEAELAELERLALERSLPAAPAPVPAPAPPLGASRSGDPLSMSRVGPPPLEEEEESDVLTPPDGSPERPLSPEPPEEEGELARALGARRRALAESELGESTPGASSLFGPEAPAAPSPAPSKSVEELHAEISRKKEAIKGLVHGSPKAGRLTSDIRILEGEIRRKEQGKKTGAEAAADLEARKKIAGERVSPAERHLETPVESPEEEVDPESSWAAESQLDPF